MIHEEKLRLSHKGRPPFRRPFGTPAPQSKRRLQELSTSGQRFRTVFPPGSAIPFEPLPGLTEKGDSAFMQLHSCQRKSGLSAHMTGRSFSLHGPPAFTGFPLPGKKAKSPAVCPYSSHRRRVPTGGPRKTLCVRILTGDLRRDMTRPFFQYKWEYGTMDIVRENLSHVSLFVKILRC